MREYIKERNEALFSLDRTKIENFFKKRGASIPTNDLVFWGGICKAICYIPDAPVEVVSKAKLWLAEHNMQETITI